jgi:hypothetical protein
MKTNSALQILISDTLEGMPMIRAISRAKYCPPIGSIHYD